MSLHHVYRIAIIAALTLGLILGFITAMFTRPACAAVKYFPPDHQFIAVESGCWMVGEGKVKCNYPQKKTTKIHRKTGGRKSNESESRAK